MSAITIPEGFFPPPGVPFSTEAQRDVAVVMHNIGAAKVETKINGAWWDCGSMNGREQANNYRLAPPKPRTVGPFESSFETYTYPSAKISCDALVVNAAYNAGICRVRVTCTATAEEIL